MRGVGRVARGQFVYRHSATLKWHEEVNAHTKHDAAEFGATPLKQPRFYSIFTRCLSMKERRKSEKTRHSPDRSLPSDARVVHSQTTHDTQPFIISLSQLLFVRIIKTFYAI